MGEALGLDWFTPRKATSPFQSPGGILDREVRFTYSLQGPHFIEILERSTPRPIFTSPAAGAYTTSATTPRTFRERPTGSRITATGGS